jgi:hypothetical protein
MTVPIFIGLLADNGGIFSAHSLHWDRGVLLNGFKTVAGTSLRADTWQLRTMKKCNKHQITIFDFPVAIVWFYTMVLLPQ